MPDEYQPRRAARARHIPLRGLDYHVHEWGDASMASPARPTLVLLHGWMDVGASFQFLVDELDAIGDAPRHVLAPDWRGFGRTAPPGSDSYWFPDYLGDLDALLHTLAPQEAVDLLGHSMGGNVAMGYAGVRPDRIRRLMNLEGFGMPATQPEQAPERLGRWLDELRTEPVLRDYDSLDAVASRLQRNNPRLPGAKARWLATHWSAPGANGRWRILGDPAHRRVNPVLYRVDEVLATWRRIRAPLLWVEGELTDTTGWWGDRYPRAEFDARLAVVADLRRCRLEGAGHMLHHDQPRALAKAVAAFLDEPA